MSRKLFFRGIVAVVVIVALYRIFTYNSAPAQVHLIGETMGTITYNVKYLEPNSTNYQKEIDSVLVFFNQSLSTYIPSSEISGLNQTGLLVNPSKMMLDVLSRSKDVFTLTEGAFDPTVGPLVNAWGFGPGRQPTAPDSAEVAELLTKVGYEKVAFSTDTVRMDPGMYLDFSAIAKGYGVDLVGEFLEKKGIVNYMVEIGGEVRARGTNQEGKSWSIGIEDPVVAKDERKLLAVVRLDNKSMATSGNYRNYYEVDGRIIAHTIDPKTGYSSLHHLLSASVFAPDCMTADAYATAFMVMGVESSKSILEKADFLDAFLIYEENDTIKTYASPGIINSVENTKE